MFYFIVIYTNLLIQSIEKIKDLIIYLLKIFKKYQMLV